MAITNLLEEQDIHSSTTTTTNLHHVSKTKIIFIIVLFIISLALFVFQTEFTSQAYKLNFLEPVILLLVTHGSWWLLWPLQIIFISLWKTFDKFKKSKKQEEQITTTTTTTNININSGSGGIQYQRLNSTSGLLENDNDNNNELHQLQIPLEHIDYYKYFKKCIVKQFHNVYHTSILIYQANIKGDRSTTHLNQIIDESPHISNSSSIIDCIKTFISTPSIKYVLTKALLVTIVLTVAGFTWYGAMAMTYAADVTAIYNCSAFTAYAFAIPLLNEKFSWLKASSVIIAISGVFIVAYSGNNNNQQTDDKDNDNNPYPYRFWGNLIILIGAILYGYYEVLYKKYLCIPNHLSKIITPRRQLTFANFIMGFFGFFTFTIVLIGIILVELFHLHHFNLFNYGENTTIIWIYIIGSIISNLLFSASFLSLMALTNPVLSSVSSLLTIFLIGLVEWWIFNNKLGFQQLLGDLLVIIGFIMLTIASWNEISEGNEDDEVEAVSTYSFALSTEDNR